MDLVDLGSSISEVPATPEVHDNVNKLLDMDLISNSQIPVDQNIKDSSLNSINLSNVNDLLGGITDSLPSNKSVIATQNSFSASKCNNVILSCTVVLLV